MSVDPTKPLETVPCERNPKPVPVVVTNRDAETVVVWLSGPWLDKDDKDESSRSWLVRLFDGEFLTLDGKIRNV